MALEMEMIIEIILKFVLDNFLVIFSLGIILYVAKVIK